MSFMLAFGLASIMLVIGVVLRAKIPFLKNMLVPASVIAGLLGFIFMNILGDIEIGTNTNMFTEIVNHLFTISFISISLTSTSGGEASTAKNIVRGALGLGIVWCLLYALTPLLGGLIIMALGGVYDMEPIYGMMVQFGFCQGPGQAATYGMILENDGWKNAATVGMAFASIGFIAAFLVGVPAAKLGIRKGIAKHGGKLDEITKRGYLHKEEQTEQMTRDTTVNSNIETLSFHFAIIGLCYVLAILIGKLLSFIPGIGASLNGMMFMNGMYAAYIVKAIMKLFKIDYLLDNTLQSKITGWTSDYLVVCAFMAVSVQIINQWLIPILVVGIATTIVTFAVCFYFGQRFGGDNDFERTLGLYGTCCGTVPSGISLIRIVDPNFKTSTAVELGACNLAMLFSTPVYIIILLLSNGTIKLLPSFIGLALCIVLYIILLKVMKLWKNKTYSWK